MINSHLWWKPWSILLAGSFSNQLLVILVDVRVNKHFPWRTCFSSFVPDLLNSSTDLSVSYLPAWRFLQTCVDNGAELALLNFENVFMFCHYSGLLTQLICLFLFVKFIVKLIQLIAVVLIVRKDKLCVWMDTVDTRRWIILLFQHWVLFSTSVPECISILQRLRIICSSHVQLVQLQLSASYIYFNNMMRRFNIINELALTTGHHAPRQQIITKYIKRWFQVPSLILASELDWAVITNLTVLISSQKFNIWRIPVSKYSIDNLCVYCFWDFNLSCCWLGSHCYQTIQRI